MKVEPAIQERLKKIPQIDKLLLNEEIAVLREKYPILITEFARESASELREKILAGKIFNNPETIAVKLIKAKLEYCLNPKLKNIINGTGVILHTGLGRAPLSEAARKRIAEIADGYCSLEYNLETGSRGQRLNITDNLICSLTGAELSAVVNNNAAAVMLALNSIAGRKEVIVSRGELVEIGGAFRIPEVMKKSGAKMVEVGTTNKTNVKDYEEAITDRTAAVLKVHTSNYRVMGFTQEVSIEEIVKIARAHKLAVISDLGGGILTDLREWGLPYEPVVREHIEAGADIVTFSGDKVLGGPQSGILAGKRWAVEKCRKNHLMRALRVDKLILGALEETLKVYLAPGDLLKENLTLRMLTEKVENIRARAENFAGKLEEAGHPNLISVETRGTYSQAGSGALPLEKIESYAVYIKPAGSLEKYARLLRTGENPVVGILQNDELVLDFRTVFAKDEERMKRAIITAANRMGNTVIK